MGVSGIGRRESMWVGGGGGGILKKKKKKTGWEMGRKKSSKTKPEIRA